MEIDASSSESNSSSEYTSSDDEELETVCVGGARVHIPQGLCENKDIFQEFFSEPTWNNLSDASKHHLRSYLPFFPDNDDEEKEVTLRRLFNRQNFKFGTPFDNFFKHLQAGHYRPDIARMRLLIRKAERKEAKLRHRKYRDQLELDVKDSRKKLLAQMGNLPPGTDIRQEHKNNSISVQSLLDPIDYRTKKRYFQELANIKSKIGESGVSSDENYPEGAPVGITRKQRKHLNGLKNELSSTGEKLILSTLSLKQNGFDLERNILPNHNPFTITEESFKILMANHRKRKLEFGEDLETNCNGLTISDVIQRTKLDYKKLPPPVIKNNESTKSSKKKHKYDYRRSLSPEMLKLSLLNDHTSLSELESDSDSCVDPVHKSTKRKTRVKTPTKPIPILLETEIKVEPVDEIVVPRESNSPFVVEPLKLEEPIKIETVDTTKNYRTATLSDLDGIDMMNIPIELDESEILDFNRPELMQETHSNFLSLIRDIICSTSEHRMDMSNLRERLRIWQENPISPLNDWYSSTDNWLNLLQPAINFLSGNSFEQPDDFVPYIEYKPQLDMYQWIGAGRDSDVLLANLCNYWLEHKQEDRSSPIVKEELDVELIDRVQTPPPPRFPTSWSVQKADVEEIRLYREQEKQRYDNPHKSFTYRCNGYESVVGPIKGIYNSATSNTKARGHNMLCADRPNFVTILSLVRDAAARLPNGEGTRAEICELLKCSQYISSTAPDNVLQSVVSGALDRMHTQFDPCVKYDSKRKIWIYLHRNRSEEDFDRLHQQYQTIGRNLKKNVKIRAPPKPKIVKPQEIKITATTATPTTSEEVINKPTTTPVNSHTIMKTVKMLPDPSTIVAAAEEKNKPANVVPAISQPVAVSIAKPSPKPVIKTVTATSSLLHETVKQSIQKSIKRPKLITHTELPQTKSNSIDIATTQIRRPIQQESVLQQNNFVNAPTINTTTTTPTVLSQDLIHTLTAHKPQHQVVIKQEGSEISEKRMHHQLIQSLTPQQLQNIKNVTLLRNVTPSSAANIVLQPQVEVSQCTLSQPANTVTTLTNLSTQPQIRLQQQQVLSSSAQQQILTSLKQKVIPTSIHMANVSAMQTQSIVVKQKALNTITKTIPAGASLLGTSTVSTAKPTTAPSSVPLVAKVLTNAAGQVISVESLLAHQKQHGSLPQGTTLRVSGGKGSHNIIQLSSPSKSSPQHITVSAQNQLMSLINQQQQQQHQQLLQQQTHQSQPKLIVSTAQLATTLTASNATNSKLTKTIVKPQITSAKFTSRIGPQIINARFVTEPNKLNQTQKVIIGPNQIRFNSKSATLTRPTNTIRMVNASSLSGLNIGHISGKPVLLASKSPTTLHNLQSGNIIIQSQPNTSGAVNNVTMKTSMAGTTTYGQGPQGQVVLSAPQQLKMQQHQLVQVKGNSVTTQGGQILLGGQQVRLQNTITSAGNVSNTQRLLLASQGQGGQIVAQQILLPAGFQGTAINIKGLQGVKVIPIAAGQATKNLPRQVFARVMSPTRTAAAPQINLTSSDSSDNNTPTLE